MRITPKLERFFQSDWQGKCMLLESLAAVTGASLAVAILPFRYAVRLGSRPLGRDPRHVGLHLPYHLSRTVDTVSRNVPWRVVCFQKGLALQWMLRRRGYNAKLRYGLGFGAPEELLAHVWVVVGEEIVTGEAGVEAFRSVAEFPEVGQAHGA